MNLSYKSVATGLIVSALTFTACQNSRVRMFSSDPTPRNVKQLVDWETKANGAGERSNQVIDIKHYEIPLSAIEKDIRADLDPAVRESVIFERDGVEYVRWIINPEDTKWHKELETWLSSKGLDTEQKSLFKGYYTASRSMIVVNPENGASMSLKVSTNNTGGNWRDKKQDWGDAKQIRKISDWVKSITEKMETDHLVIQDEPFAVGIPEIDQAMIMRSLNDVPSGKHYYLPGFSALHSGVGRQIAELNGESDPVKFWGKHYAEALGRAMAEFTASTGVTYDSPHSQNFLVELDENMKPTGRIVLRDFGDSYILKEFVENTHNKEMVAIWEAENVNSKKLNMSVGLLHGNQAPSWMTAEAYTEWSERYFKTFEDEFSQITGVPLTELKKTQYGWREKYSYFSKSYDTKSINWKKWIEYANCLSGESTTLSGKKCLEMFTRRHKTVNCEEAVAKVLIQ
ncbi:MAG: hypothetical protein OHK0056_21390 [Bacteriovoracaceae bacterium]